MRLKNLIETNKISQGVAGPIRYHLPSKTVREIGSFPWEVWCEPVRSGTVGIIMLLHYITATKKASLMKTGGGRQS